MAPLLAHAGEEGLYVLVPIVLIVLLVQLGRRQARSEQDRSEQDRSDDDRAREPTDGDEPA